jgi:hypothetical protein
VRNKSSATHNSSIKWICGIVLPGFQLLQININLSGDIHHKNLKMLLA